MIRDPNENIKLYVEPYEYRPDGNGVQIFATGGVPWATVRGTSYPIGSACESDVALARKMAAGPELLAVLEHIRDEYCEGGMLDGTETERKIMNAIARAKGGVV